MPKGYDATPHHRAKQKEYIREWRAKSSRMYWAASKVGIAKAREELNAAYYEKHRAKLKERAAVCYQKNKARTAARSKSTRSPGATIPKRPRPLCFAGSVARRREQQHSALPSEEVDARLIHFPAVTS